MASYAIIKNGIVENIIETEAGSGFLITLENQGYITKATEGLTDFGIGWNYSDENGFTLDQAEPVEPITTDTGE
jgi:hypothetical protein